MPPPQLHPPSRPLPEHMHLGLGLHTPRMLGTTNKQSVKHLQASYKNLPCHNARARCTRLGLRVQAAHRLLRQGARRGCLARLLRARHLRQWPKSGCVVCIRGLGLAWGLPDTDSCMRWGVGQAQSLLAQAPQLVHTDRKRGALPCTPTRRRPPAMLVSILQPATNPWDLSSSLQGYVLRNMRKAASRLRGAQRSGLWVPTSTHP